MKFVRLFRALLILFIIPSLRLAPPLAAQTNPPPFTSEPSSVTQSVALGSSQALGLVLRNDGVATRDLQLFPAFVDEDSGALLAPADAAPSLGHHHPRVDPAISQAQASDPSGHATFLVILADQADLHAAYTITDWDARGAYVYETLRDHAARSQAPLRTLLDARGLDYTPFWIVNALAVRGNASDLAVLASDVRVAQLRAVQVAVLGESSEKPNSAIAQNSPYGIASPFPLSLSYCHPERSEGSLFGRKEMLRCAQHDKRSVSNIASPFPLSLSYCHPERSEGSLFGRKEMLRCAQHDKRSVSN
ncbi:MAG: hypothetical protein EI684_13005, partial [Candidatus Viridilinea halotolerans]